MEAEGGRDWEHTRPDQMTYFDIYRERPIRLTVRALVPTKEHPKVTQWEMYWSSMSHNCVHLTPLVYHSALLNLLAPV